MTFLSKSSVTRLLGMAALCLPLALYAAADVDAAKRSKRLRPIKKPKFDPSADRVDVFKAMKDKKISVRMIPKNAFGGKLLIKNLTDKPLTVTFPKGFVGVQVMKQFGGGGFGGGGLGGGGLGGGGLGGGQGGQGGGQALGGGLGGGQGGGGLGGGGLGGGGQGGGQGGGFFSVPAERSVIVPYKSVCLEHGKKEPNMRFKYRIVKVEQFTKNKSLQQLIGLIGTNRINKQVAQAAAWHLSSKMSWRQLATKKQRHLGGAPPTPYFSLAQVMVARRLVAIADSRARQSKTVQPMPKPRSVRSRLRRRTR